jgi:branched-chain amino acid transport system permease protein
MSNILIEYLLFGASLSATWILIASGFTLLYGVTRIVNVAYGLPYALAAYMLYYFTSSIGLSSGLAIPLALLVALLVDVALFKFVIEPIMDNHELTITATFLILIAATQVFILLFSPQPKGVPLLISGRVEIMGVTMVAQRLALVPVAVVTLLGLHLFLKYTLTGKVVRALSQDPVAVRLLGVSVGRYYLLTIAISSFLSALAGLLFVSLEVATPTTAFDPIIPIFTVTILGGMGSAPGAIIAGLLLGYTEVAATYFLGSQFRGVLPIIMAIVAIQLRPMGLLGRRGRVV